MVALPPGLIVIDTDSAEVEPLIAELLASQGPTLTVATRKGVHRYYRLPAGRTLNHKPGWLPKVDVLAHRVMAPGSVVDGSLYRVRERLPVATLSDKFADLLELEVGSPRPPASMQRTFVVEDHLAPYSPDGRRASIRDARRRRQVAAGDPAATRALMELLAGDESDGRHRRIMSILVLGALLGDDLDACEAFIKGRPINSKFKDLGNYARRWLEGRWALVDVDTRPSEGAATPLSDDGYRNHYGAPELAERWRAGALDVVAERAVTELQLDRLGALVHLHASWAARYGAPHALARRVILTHLNMRSPKQVRSLQEKLKQWGLLATVEPGSLVSAETFQLIFLEPGTPTALVDVYGPPVNHRRRDMSSVETSAWLVAERGRPLLSNDEITALLAATNEAAQLEHAGREKRVARANRARIERLQANAEPAAPSDREAAGPD